MNTAAASLLHLATQRALLPVEPECTWCHHDPQNRSRLSKCGRCGARYCSAECQKKDWTDNHKGICGKDPSTLSKPELTAEQQSRLLTGFASSYHTEIIGIVSHLTFNKFWPSSKPRPPPNLRLEVTVELNPAWTSRIDAFIVTKVTTVEVPQAVLDTGLKIRRPADHSVFVLMPGLKVIFATKSVNLNTIARFQLAPGEEWDPVPVLIAANDIVRRVWSEPGHRKMLMALHE